MKEDIAERLLNLGAVAVSPSDPFIYTSGKKGPIYCDNRIIISEPEDRKVFVKAFLQVAQAMDYDVVAGVATGAVPFAAWIAESTDKPMVYIRGERKAHGKGKRIEGRLRKGDRVLVIEDLINTGGSSISACKAVEEAGGELVACIAIFTYGRAEEQFRKEGIVLDCLSDFETLLKKAMELNMIDDSEYKALKTWQADPEAWDETRG